ncbi:serine hydrolase domain-containing protein [Streptomyces sp. G-G2]|uniref:serine hydrolase domain-containing protein n=1 Tax=Streptomyces sp. G-G2 TaxID=3046201 RepID=UPI0024B91303|nr:serine hydrolase domain-containing protein [Streptomyces sp. G-G2]MDJ0382481.1 serine hydrolase domain-containing protein [Streptomyces sp. G-G2]
MTATPDGPPRARARRGRARTALVCAAALLGAALPTAARAAGPGRAPQPRTGACAASPAPAGGEAKQILDIARQALKDLDLNAVVLRVNRDGREVVTGALGQSMTDVPATADMHFRAGSVAIVYLGVVLLQLVDEGKAGLDDPVSRWVRGVPHGDRITLRMLGSSTSGLHDYVTDPKFIAALYADPFRQWTPAQLEAISTAHPLWYPPGTNWSYSHANFVILGAALEKISGTPLATLLQQRVTGPAGLADTRSETTPVIQEPVLHAFDAERGTYEESTFWNPSWTTAPGAVLTTHICDLARSAEVIGTGQLLPAKSFATQLDPGTVGLGKAVGDCSATVCLVMSAARHFGLGVIVENGWILTNPSFTGYAAVQAYLPAEHLAIAVSTTTGAKSPAGNTSQTIAHRITAALTPRHALKG